MKGYNLLIKYFPIVKWSQEYKLSYVKNDVIAGLTVGVTLIPQGLAYGSLAGLQPQYGLYSGLWGPFIYFFFGTSKDLTIGPTAILSLLVAYYVSLSGVRHNITYPVLLALFTGAIQLLLGLSKLGFLANYMSPTVVSGFTTSAAMTIAWGQIMNLLGLKKIRTEFFLSIYDVLSKIKETNLSDVCIGIGCIIMLLFFKVMLYYTQRKSITDLSQTQKCLSKSIWFICICANIIVIISASAIGLVLERYGITELSFPDKIDGGLPKFELPKFVVTNGTTIFRTTKQVFAEIGTGIPIITLIALVEAMAIGKSFAKKNGYKIRSSQEFIAIGLSNIMGSLFQAFPSTGSFSRTAINSQCSSKSPFSGIITGCLVLLSLRFMTPYFAYIPKSSFASIIIVAVIFMTDFRSLVRLWKLNKYDFSTWILTFSISLAFGVEFGVLSGVAFSFLPIILQASQPRFKVKHCSSTFLGSFLWFPFCSRLMTMVDLTDFEDHKYSILNLLGVYSIDSAIINTVHEMGFDFEKRKKSLIVIIDNIQILEMLMPSDDDVYGMHCFSSYQEAQLFYEDKSNDDWIGENVLLLSKDLNNTI